jgi:hypothetical protein
LIGFRNKLLDEFKQTLHPALVIMSRAAQVHSTWKRVSAAGQNCGSSYALSMPLPGAFGLEDQV